MFRTARNLQIELSFGELLMCFHVTSFGDFGGACTYVGGRLGPISSGAHGSHLRGWSRGESHDGVGAAAGAGRRSEAAEAAAKGDAEPRWAAVVRPARHPL